MTSEEIKSAIAAITAQLKGPMSNLQRAMLVADRKDLRADLAVIEAREAKKKNQ